MIDREQTISCLNEIAEYFRECRMNASFASKAENHFFELQSAAYDAAEMLKDQEPKPQRYKEHDIFHLPFCPNTVCNAVLDKYWHYCPYCGTKFYWDEELDEQQKAVKWDE